MSDVRISSPETYSVRYVVNETQVSAPGCVTNQLTWSVSAEFQFYAVTPFLVWCHWRCGPRAGAAVTTLAMMGCLVLRGWKMRRWFKVAAFDGLSSTSADYGTVYLSASTRGAEYCVGVLAYFAHCALGDARPESAGIGRRCVEVVLAHYGGQLAVLALYCYAQPYARRAAQIDRISV